MIKFPTKPSVKAVTEENLPAVKRILGVHLIVKSIMTISRYSLFFFLIANYHASITLLVILYNILSNIESDAKKTTKTLEKFIKTQEENEN